MGESPPTAAAAAPPATTTPAPSPQTRSTASLTTRAAAAREKPWVRDVLALTFVCAASLIVAVVHLRLWQDPDPRVPIVQDGDAPSLLAVFKDIHEHGWIWHNPSLG